MKDNLTLIALLLCLCFSCKKGTSEDEVSFPVTLYPENLIKKSEIRLYTKTGEINDQAAVTRLTKNNTGFTVPTPFKPDNSKLVILSKDSANFGSGIKYKIIKDGDLFLFYSVNTFLSHNSLSEQLLKYQAPKTAVPFQSGASYLTNEIRVARGDYQRLSLYRTGYLLKRANSITESGILFNELTDNISPKLGAQDTLAVMETFFILAGK